MEIKLKSIFGVKKEIKDGMLIHPPNDENMLFILRYGWSNEGYYGWFLESISNSKHYQFDKSVLEYIIVGEEY